MDIGDLRFDIEADTSSLDRAERRVDEFTDSTEKAERSVDQFGDQTKRSGAKAERAMRSASSSANRAETQFSSLRSMVAALGGVLVAQQVVRYSDAWNNAANQLRQVTSGTQELAGAQSTLLALANDTRSSFTSTANLYSRLARSTTEMALSTEELNGLTRTINQSFAVSGATAEEASAAITQLSQGLAAGALRGDEFNSVSEQAPGIMRAIAESLDMTIGELRDFAAEGGITAEIVVNALQGASDTIADQFSKSVATFGQQMAIANNNMTAFVGENDLLQGAVSAAGNAIVSATGFVHDHDTQVNLLTGTLGGAALAYGTLQGAIYAATAAQKIFNAVVRANPYVLAATALAGLAGALYSVRNETIELGETTATIGEWIGATWDTVVREFGDDALAMFEKARAMANNIADVYQAVWSFIATAAHTMVNTVIGVFFALGRSIGVVSRGIYKAFSESFQRIGDLARAAGRDIMEALAGNFEADNLAAALNRNIKDPFLEVLGDIRSVSRESLSQDYLGGIIGSAGDKIAELRDTIATTVEVNRFGPLSDSLFAVETFADSAAESVKALNAAMPGGSGGAGAPGDTASGGTPISGGFGGQVRTGGLMGGAQEQNPWQQWLESARTAFSDFDQLQANTAQNFQTSFGNAFESVIFDSQNLREAFATLAESMLRSIVNAIGQMIAQWLAYKAVQTLVGSTAGAAGAAAMASQASAASVMAGLNAFAATAAIPIVGPALAPGAAAAALSATAPMAASVAAISASGITGMAHDGIDSVPSEGTWLLDRGERVVDSRTNGDLKSFLSSGQPTSGGGAPVVNLNEDSSKAGQVNQSTMGDKQVIDIFVANIRNGGAADKALRGSYQGMKRQGK